MKCPECKGKGYSEGFGCPGFIPMTLPCFICNGSGEFPADLIYDPGKGRKMRENRQAQDETIREMWKRTGIKPTEISRMERGYFKKEADHA